MYEERLHIEQVVLGRQNRDPKLNLSGIIRLCFRGTAGAATANPGLHKEMSSGKTMRFPCTQQQASSKHQAVKSKLQEHNPGLSSSHLT